MARQLHVETVVYSHSPSPKNAQHSPTSNITIESCTLSIRALHHCPSCPSPHRQAQRPFSFTATATVTQSCIYTAIERRDHTNTLSFKYPHLKNKLPYLNERLFTMHEIIQWVGSHLLQGFYLSICSFFLPFR